MKLGNKKTREDEGYSDQIEWFTQNKIKTDYFADIMVFN